jgi:hypothetical protein
MLKFELDRGSNEEGSVMSMQAGDSAEKKTEVTGGIDALGRRVRGVGRGGWRRVEQSCYVEGRHGRVDA